MKIQYLGPEAGGVTLGIDPGLDGALAFYGEGPLETPDFFTVFDMPTVGEDKQRAVAGDVLANLIGPFKPKLAVVERVSAMRGWGVGSTFRFGQAVGTVLGVLGALKIPTERVAPITWKKHYKLIGSDKEASRAYALQHWPAHQTLFARVKDHNRAEAALLAAYGRKVLS